ncbi:Uncharacterised protein [Mycobacterium tuberculosis]|nr:Uncharacterised protein [Mycobacterium tuberculosis]
MFRVSTPAASNSLNRSVSILSLIPGIIVEISLKRKGK